jgi:SAM-dependent methyltransferase
VWECGAGSGQATLDLAARFARVVATDISGAQLAEAPPHPRVEYRVAPAEASGLGTGVADLVAVAQALHWFDLPRFFAEAARVLRPGGVLAAWCYGPFRVVEGAAARPVAEFAAEVHPYWFPERALVDSGYRTIEFPFTELTAPAFEMGAEWTGEEIAGYLGTWSAASAYAKATGRDPVPALREALERAGALGRRSSVDWPLSVRAGRTAETAGLPEGRPAVPLPRSD